MRKKLLIAIATLGLILIVFAVFVSLRPSAFSVERSTTVAASPAEVFAQVNDLQLWDAWSPWKELDPQAETSLSSPSAGKGASFTWNGNDQIGEGSLTIVDTKPDKMVDVEQEFVRPFAGKANMVFTFEPNENGTQVTWHLTGNNNFVGKLVCLFMDMDAMLGPDFDRGLASLKRAVEERQSAAPPAETP